jgi:hypothetical protein
MTRLTTYFTTVSLDLALAMNLRIGGKIYFTWEHGKQ